MQPSRNVARLVEIMQALRDPATGCPWDVEQTFDTIVPYTIEEAYEVADAIDRRDAEDLREELGDLLLQVVYFSQLAEEAGLFRFEDVVETITTKMIRRHPHVFGDAAARDAGSAKGQWERMKAEEKEERRARRQARLAEGSHQDSEWAVRPDAPRTSLLDSVPRGMPALAMSTRLQAKAATVGFDWTEVAPIVAKLREETEEFEAAAASGDRAEQADELGDLFFCLVNLARRLELDPETTLRGTATKFRRRFASVEDALRTEGRTPQEASLDEMETHWQAAKRGRPPVPPVSRR